MIGTKEKRSAFISINLRTVIGTFKTKKKITLYFYIHYTTFPSVNFYFNCLLKLKFHLVTFFATYGEVIGSSKLFQFKN